MKCRERLSVCVDSKILDLSVGIIDILGKLKKQGLLGDDSPK